MIIELLCRFHKDPDDKTMDLINEELKTKELIQGDSFNKNKEYTKLLKENKCYEYSEFILNLKDVKFVNSVDDEHVSLRFNDGNTLVFKIKYEEFKAIYQTLLGVLINNFTTTEDFEKIITNGK